MLDLFIYIHHIYRTEGASAETGRLSGSFSDREMHFSNSLEQEAASTFGFLTAHAVIHDPGLMFAEIVYWRLATSGANTFQPNKFNVCKSTEYHMQMRMTPRDKIAVKIR